MEPTPEQFTEWLQESIKDGVAGKIGLVCETMAKLAYAAGFKKAEEKVQAAVDAELEACCEWMEFQERLPGYLANDLRKARRPKPPSLKEKARAEMELLETHGINACCLGTLRRAIESLPDD